MRDRLQCYLNDGKNSFIHLKLLLENTCKCHLGCHIVVICIEASFALWLLTNIFMNTNNIIMVMTCL